MQKFQNIFQNINFYLFFLLVFALPFKDNFLPTILTAWIFSWLFEGNLKQKFTGFDYKNKYYIPLAAYFILTVAAFFMAKNSSTGWYHIQEKLSMAFFPIIISGSNSLIKKNYSKILLTFILATLSVSLYLITYAFFTNLHIENGTWHLTVSPYSSLEKKYTFFQLINIRQNIFSGGWLSRILHPSYLSMFNLFSLLIIVDFFRKKLIHKKWQKIIGSIAILFLLMMIYLLQSRAGFLALAASIIAVFLLEILRKKQKRYFFAGLILLALSTTAILSSTRMQTVLKQTIGILDKKESNLAKLDARFQTNFAAFQIIKENLWTGVGPANMYDELKKQYKKYGFDEAAEERLNAHNQYLETFAGLGILGFLSLLGIIAGGFYYAYKNKHYLLFFLILILSINFLFESMLNRIQGILFMMLFYSLFIFMQPTNRQPDSNNQ